MKPYYDQDGITIYHADCADVLPSIDPASVDLVLTDPPYGAGIGGPHKHKWTSGDSMHMIVEGDDTSFDPTHLLAFGRCVLWGANFYTDKLPVHPGWIAWDKVTRNGFNNHRIAELEFAWTNFVARPLLFRHMWVGAYRDSERGPGTLHPTQKPVALMKWILDNWTQPGDLILDPYMGSGPVAQACHEMGRRYIGIEIVEEYCAITVERRLSQLTLPF